MFCSHCGNNVPLGAAFCPKCGTPLNNNINNNLNINPISKSHKLLILGVAISSVLIILIAYIIVSAGRNFYVSDNTYENN
jgi:uncharacterized membrane protein YvbJ